MFVHQPFAQPKRQTTTLLLLMITLCGGLLRGWQIGAKSLWIDEAFSVWVARQTIPEMLSWLVRIDQHPPLYYFALRAWTHIGDAFGRMDAPRSSAAWVRTLSALVSALNIPVLYALGRRLAGRTVGLLAALVLAFSPFHVYLAQETRMYALLCLNVSVATLAATCLLTAPPLSPPRKPGGRPELPPPDSGGGAPYQWRERGSAWTIYVLFTAAALWTHNTALLFWVAVNLYVLGFVLARYVRIRRQSIQRNRVFRKKPGFLPELAPPSLQHWTLAQMSILLLWLPWLKPFLQQATGVYREFWLPAPTWRTVLGAIHNLMSAFLPPTAAGTALLWSVYVVGVLLAIYRLRKQPARLALPATLFVTPIAGELLVSLRRPIFYDRTLVWASIPLYLLFAIGVTSLPARAKPVTRRYALQVFAALGLLAALNALSLREYYVRFQKEQWEEAAQYVAQRVQDRDLILYHASWTQLPFDFYLNTNYSVTKHGLPVDLFDRGLLEPKMAKSDLLRLYELMQDYDRIWLVYSHNWYTDPQNLIPDALASRAHLVNRRSFRGLEIYLYESLTPSNPGFDAPCPMLVY